MNNQLLLLSCTIDNHEKPGEEFLCILLPHGNGSDLWTDSRNLEKADGSEDVRQITNINVACFRRLDSWGERGKGGILGSHTLPYTLAVFPAHISSPRPHKLNTRNWSTIVPQIYDREFGNPVILTICLILSHSWSFCGGNGESSRSTLVPIIPLSRFLLVPGSPTKPCEACWGGSLSMIISSSWDNPSGRLGR